MKKLIVLTSTFFFISTHAQSDSLLLKRYEQLILENSYLKTDLQNELNKYVELSIAYKKDTLNLINQLREIKRELQIEQEKVSKLNKNKLVVERDNLIEKVDSLNSVVSDQNITIAKNETKLQQRRLME
ncbi:MAG: hypothetical protein IPN10_16740 [Saprospiraceae bacterium]|nr:hypothetical protein [Saprospiraceae bacterium]